MIELILFGLVLVLGSTFILALAIAYACGRYAEPSRMALFTGVVASLCPLLLVWITFYAFGNWALWLLAVVNVVVALLGIYAGRSFRRRVHKRIAEERFARSVDANRR